MQMENKSQWKYTNKEYLIIKPEIKQKNAMLISVTMVIGDSLPSWKINTFK